MEILLDVQRVERYHVQSLQQHQQQHGHWGAEAMRGLEDLVARRLADLLAEVDAVDRWRERIRKDEGQYRTARKPDIQNVSLTN